MKVLQAVVSLSLLTAMVSSSAITAVSAASAVHSEVEIFCEKELSSNRFPFSMPDNVDIGGNPISTSKFGTRNYYFEINAESTDRGKMCTVVFPQINEVADVCVNFDVYLHRSNSNFDAGISFYDNNDEALQRFNMRYKTYSPHQSCQSTPSLTFTKDSDGNCEMLFGDTIFDQWVSTSWCYNSQTGIMHGTVGGTTLSATLESGKVLKYITLGNPDWNIGWFTGHYMRTAAVTYAISSATNTPSRAPSPAPTPQPTTSPTPLPSRSPTPSPTTQPSASPTPSPTPSPTAFPSGSPTGLPTPIPTVAPTRTPTTAPTQSPTPSPTENPTTTPSALPTISPTLEPTVVPFKERIQHTCTGDGKFRIEFPWSIDDYTVHMGKGTATVKSPGCISSSKNSTSTIEMYPVAGDNSCGSTLMYLPASDEFEFRSQVYIAFTRWDKPDLQFNAVCRYSEKKVAEFTIPGFSVDSITEIGYGKWSINVTTCSERYGCDESDQGLWGKYVGGPAFIFYKGDKLFVNMTILANNGETLTWDSVLAIANDTSFDNVLYYERPNGDFSGGVVKNDNARQISFAFPLSAGLKTMKLVADVNAAGSNRRLLTSDSSPPNKKKLFGKKLILPTFSEKHNSPPEPVIISTPEPDVGSNLKWAACAVLATVGLAYVGIYKNSEMKEKSSINDGESVGLLMAKNI